MMAAHLESYRDSVRRDALEDTADFARKIPTKNPKEFPTAYDYLYASLSNAKHATSIGNTERYKYWVMQHRDALAKLHELRVKDLMKPYGTPDPSLAYAFIQEMGWKWFKFYDHTLKMQLEITPSFKPHLVWVPRFLKKWESVWLKKGVCALDADELKFIWDLKDPKIAHSIIRFKEKSPGLKINCVEGDNITYNAVIDYNSEGPVLDWSLSIFGEDV